ncbi:11317_t:CDS:2 [Ambispora leptoticha]|uniref:11317_t:CDS:1 n=1 Tax=Ambispora leptoticha TaxID=144679 RepID=A0A9N8VYB3_9GLOM|nr:11317_t:CDS:2 [Ambispora leptoticha]
MSSLVLNREHGQAPPLIKSEVEDELVWLNEDTVLRDDLGIDTKSDENDSSSIFSTVQQHRKEKNPVMEEEEDEDQPVDDLNNHESNILTSVLPDGDYKPVINLDDDGDAKMGDDYENENSDVSSESEMPPDTQEQENDIDQDQDPGFGLGSARCILEYAGTKTPMTIRTQVRLSEFMMTLKKDLVFHEAHYQEAVLTFKDFEDPDFIVSISQENYYAQHHTLNDILNLHHNFQKAKNQSPSYLHILLTLRDGFISQIQRIRYSITEVVRANSAGNLPQNPIVLDDDDSDPGIHSDESDNEGAQSPLTEPTVNAGKLSVPSPHLTFKNNRTKNGLPIIDDDDLAPYSDIDETDRDQPLPTIEDLDGETEVPLDDDELNNDKLGEEEINDEKNDNSTVTSSHVETEQVHDDTFGASEPSNEEGDNKFTYYFTDDIPEEVDNDNIDHTNELDVAQNNEEYVDSTLQANIEGEENFDTEDWANDVTTDNLNLDSASAVNLKRGRESIFTTDDIDEESDVKKARII